MTTEALPAAAPLASPLTSHVLDLALGRPAENLAVQLDALAADGTWTRVAERATGPDGRVGDLLAGGRLEARVYRLNFDTGPYFRGTGRPAFYPRVEIIFSVTAPNEHHHLPLLLSPFGYSTYRGS